MVNSDEGFGIGIWVGSRVMLMVRASLRTWVEKFWHNVVGKYYITLVGRTTGCEGSCS